MKKICILGSGGDAPGMNACLEAVFTHGAMRGWIIMGTGPGYEGLVQDRMVVLNRDNATGISQLTGCVLSAGRSDSFSMMEGKKRALENLKKQGIDALIVMGGNGSARGAKDLMNLGFPVIVIPSTIDNDVFFTKNSLGFSSAVEESVRLVDNLNGTMRTNNRDHIVQVMGWHCDELAQMIGVATFADIIDVEGNRHTPTQIAKFLEHSRASGKQSNLIILQEKRGKGIDVIGEAMETVNYLGDLQRATKSDRIRMTTLGHLQRGATPSARDRWLGANYGRIAIESIEMDKTGVAVGLVGDDFVMVPL